MVEIAVAATEEFISGGGHVVIAVGCEGGSDGERDEDANGNGKLADGDGGSEVLRGDLGNGGEINFVRLLLPNGGVCGNWCWQARLHTTAEAVMELDLGGATEVGEKTAAR